MEKVLLTTVGTGIGPDKEERVRSLAHGIVYLIKHYAPSKTLFFGSEESFETVESVKEQYHESTDETFNYKFVTINNIDSFEECFDKIKRGIEDYRDYDIVIDYTSGTKTMTMSAALCSMLYHKKLSLISGKRKNGIVIPGTESIREQSLYAAYDKHLLDKMKELINIYQFDEARIVLNQIVILEDKEQYELLIDCYDAWDKFDHGSAKDKLTNIKTLNLSKNKEFLGKLLRMDKKEPFYLADLLNNAKRRAMESKYDDAVARLYRVIELVAQYKLRKDFQIDTADIDISKIPQERQKDYEQIRNSRKGKMQIGLVKAFTLLKELNDDIGVRFHQNLRLHNLLGRRNASILAHGMNPIGREAYEELYKLAEEFCRCVVENLDELMQKAEFSRL